MSEWRFELVSRCRITAGTDVSLSFHFGLVVCGFGIGVCHEWLYGVMVIERRTCDRQVASSTSALHVSRCGWVISWAVCTVTRINWTERTSRSGRWTRPARTTRLTRTAGFHWRYWWPGSCWCCWIPRPAWPPGNRWTARFRRAPGSSGTRWTAGSYRRHRSTGSAGISWTTGSFWKCWSAGSAWTTGQCWTTRSHWTARYRHPLLLTYCVFIHDFNIIGGSGSAI